VNLHSILTNRIVTGAISGVLAAAAVDYHAFLTWKSFDDVKHDQWSTALFRWVQGAVMGAATSAGLGALTGPA